MARYTILIKKNGRWIYLRNAPRRGQLVGDRRQFSPLEAWMYRAWMVVTGARVQVDAVSEWKATRVKQELSRRERLRVAMGLGFFGGLISLGFAVLRSLL